MSEFVIYRKRLIPPECICLTDDLILRRTDTLIVTSWDAFHPRPDLMRGISCYHLTEGAKVSKILHDDGTHHWYIDVADFQWNAEGTVLTMTDLLADIVIASDGSVRVLDLDELADAYDRALIDASLLKKSLHTLDRLLRELYSSGISRLTAPIEEMRV